MPSTYTLLLFFPAALVLLIIPGPSVLLAVPGVEDRRALDPRAPWDTASL